MWWSQRLGISTSPFTVHQVTECYPLCVSAPFISAVASVVSDSCVVLQSQPCMTSYFKGGVESWRVAGPGQGSCWGLGLVPQAPSLQWSHSISSRPELRTLIYGTGGLPSNQPWGPPRWWHRTTDAQKHTQADMQANLNILIHWHKHCAHVYVSTLLFFVSHTQRNTS